MKVVKFGGSSLADGAHFQKVISIITADPTRQVVVVSAPGKRFAEDTKVTDLLIEYALTVIKHQNTAAIIQKIDQRYKDIGNFFDLPTRPIEKIIKKLQSLPFEYYPSNSYLMAAFKANGERLNAMLLTSVLKHLGIAARFLDPFEAGIIVSDDPSNASVLPETYKNLAHLQFGSEKLIFPGFFGFTPNGQIATFSRGGSDITGAIVARGLNAQLYENFTDVNAIYAADPRIINHPHAIKKMTYREMRELSYAGFSVFHDEAIIPAIKGQVPINVKNTNHPDLPGTLIVPEKGFKPHSTITGVASSDRFAALYLHRYLLNKEVGFTLKLLQILYKYDVSYEHMPSGIDDLTIIFDKNQLNSETIHEMCHDIQNTLKPDQLNWIDDYAIIMVVGEGMRSKIGTIEDILRPLAENEIGVHMINQGASRISIMLGTKQADAKKAVKQIYQQFFEPEAKINEGSTIYAD
ncbi:aspartate kinase [Pediococcus ethanolidurans]|uniref:aspartate kinase n=1 Tax=Pediococcus ethanolidurans TaxID=319653 RepID=UPI001C1EBBBA|nr:aspartate kinase [Pediococcus ethanolidurans]MBU7553991.1 aspartate kinase [Pediococcus ethanolidurans]MBU7563170.1 aspartate kinase [Pediococcus ethanolidurans]MCV3327321.1 aspartate kinase [Pediococcus ethanolidurans]MCV3554815.1 aspartate kinase [Pediococcus ethanolidurans]